MSALSLPGVSSVVLVRLVSIFVLLIHTKEQFRCSILYCSKMCKLVIGRGCLYEHASFITILTLRAMGTTAVRICSFIESREKKTWNIPYILEGNLQKNGDFYFLGDVP